MFKIGSIFIPVTNIEKSASWYEKYLGAKKIDNWEDGAGFYLPIGSTQLALVKVETPQPTEFNMKRNQRNSYYNFVVNDIETAHRHFKDNGVAATSIDAFGEMKFFDFFDLDGNPFSVVNEVAGSSFHSDNVREMQEEEK